MAGVSSRPAHRAVEIESLVSARLLLEPQLAGDRLYFLSDRSGRLSLHSMRDGRVSDALLPPDITLKTPHQVPGHLYRVLPDLDRLLVLIDRRGGETFQPMFVPLDGGEPEPVLGDRYAGRRFLCAACTGERAVFLVEDPGDPMYETIRVDLRTAEVTTVARSKHQSYCIAANDDASALVLADMITVGDEVIWLWRDGFRTLLLGAPLEERTHAPAPTGIRDAAVTSDGVLFVTAAVDDRYGLGWVALDRPPQLEPVEITGTAHAGEGELVAIAPLDEGRYRLIYNIDGCSWVYAGRYEARRFVVEETLCGAGDLRDGVVQAIHFERATRRHVLSFSTATSPAQIYLVGGATTTRLTDERVRDLPSSFLAPGEDASFASHDGLRISARLYLPARELGFEGPRPLVFYIHGGPHKQERPDFTWFSMPLIQWLTLHGFAVFVPNARGSSGYGLSFQRRVDRDWGGSDRLDHVAALEQLRADPRLDTTRAAVIGRSYGGYMALTLAGRHADRWKAACTMFGPYDLVSWLERVPETHKTYYHEAIGHPERDRQHLVERSPSTYFDRIACPLLVIQGALDPHILERESAALVDALRSLGKDVDSLVFDDEGHDVVKPANKATCYTRIVDFFSEHL